MSEDEIQNEVIGNIGGQVKTSFAKIEAIADLLIEKRCFHRGRIEFKI